MLKQLLMLISFIAIIVNIGCNSKPKVEDGLNGEGSDIVEQPLSFDPMGSDSGAIPGLATIYFEYDSSKLSESSKQTLAANAEWIRSNASATIQIEGHTDARGSNEYNLTLGERRAQSVRTYLQGMGVDVSNVSVISYGEEKMLSVGESNSDHAKNRRANFVPR